MKEKSIINHKLFLYMTEFFSGMSVMAVELGASRLLAPYFSSSQIVWTIIIGTIMIAMALGNIYGGRSADKNPNPDRLYGRICIAAIWIALIPILGKYIILLISAVLIVAIDTNFLIWAAFLACMVIFVFPLFLLGTVTPSLVKYSVESLENNGKTVGNLGAFNTIGSIIGTFVPTFITIPAVGTTITFLIFAGILIVISLIYFVANHKRSVKCIIAIITLIACFGLSTFDSFAFWEDNLLYEGESVYNYLQVKEDGDSIILSTNVLFGVQSIYKKNDELTGMYYDYALAAPLMAGVSAADNQAQSDASRKKRSETDSQEKKQTAVKSGIKSDIKSDNFDILVLGMGSGTYAMQCMKYFDGVKVEGVEIDEKITKLAKDYFELPESVKVTTYDGRAYLAATDKKYDVIMVDAYQDITIPFQMSSVEFFRLVKSHLNENGVMVVNMNMRGQSEGNINQYLADTISAVFECVYTVDVTGSSNRELFAFETEETIENFENNIAAVNDKKLKDLLKTVGNHLEKYEAGNYIMTDDKAPVEILGMKVIDELIKDELGYYKEVFKKDGIKGLIDDFS